MAPGDLEFTEIPIGNLPLYSPDYDSGLPAEAKASRGRSRHRRHAVRDARVQPVDPRRAEERHRLGVAAVGPDSFDHMPAAVIGTSAGAIGTALAQQSLRAVLGTATPGR